MSTCLMIRRVITDCSATGLRPAMTRMVVNQNRPPTVRSIVDHHRHAIDAQPPVVVDHVLNRLFALPPEIVALGQEGRLSLGLASGTGVGPLPGVCAWPGRRYCVDQQWAAASGAPESGVRNGRRAATRRADHRTTGFFTCSCLHCLHSYRVRARRTTRSASMESEAFDT